MLGCRFNKAAAAEIAVHIIGQAEIDEMDVPQETILLSNRAREGRRRFK